MPTVRDRAICVRLLDWSETSQIVVLMSERHGKVSATAKGAKRRTPSTLAKFSGGVELLTLGQAVLITKRTASLANLIEWDLRDAHWHLRRDLSAYRLAMYAADLVHHLAEEHDAHPVTFAALERLLKELADPGEHAAAVLRFQWDVIRDMGYRPMLDRDAQTGAGFDAAAETLAFSASAGGLVADTGAPDRWRVRRSTASLLGALDRGADAAETGADGATMWRASKLLCAYLRAILEKQLPTMEVLLGGGTKARRR